MTTAVAPSYSHPQGRPIPFPNSSLLSTEMVPSPNWMNVFNRTLNQVFPASPKTPPVVSKQTTVGVTTPVQYFHFPPTPMTPSNSPGPIPISSPSCQVACSSPSMFNFPDQSTYRPATLENTSTLSSPGPSPPQMYQQLQQTTPPQIHQASPPQLQQTPPQLQQTPPQLQHTPPPRIPSTGSYLDTAMYLQTSPPTLLPETSTCQTLSSCQQTSPPQGISQNPSPTSLYSSTVPQNPPPTSQYPPRVPQGTLTDLQTPPPYVPNLTYQESVSRPRQTEENDYSTFLLQQCNNNTSLPDLTQNYVRNSLPPQLNFRATQQVPLPLVQMPSSPTPQTSHRYYTTGAPYGSLVYVTHGKVKPRKRTAFTDTQQAQLEEAFKKKNYISTAERVQLSLEIGLSVHTILLWYQNKRARLKKKGINSVRSD